MGPLVAFKYGLTHRCIVEASHHRGDNNDTDGTSGGDGSEGGWETCSDDDEEGYDRVAGTDAGDGGGGISCDGDDGSLSYRQLVFSHTLLLHRVAAMTNFRLEGPWNLAPLLKRRGMAGPQQAKTWQGSATSPLPSPSPAPSTSSCEVIPVMRRNEMTVRTGKWLWDWDGMEKVCFFVYGSMTVVPFLGILYI